MRRTIRTLCGGTLLLLAAACSSDKPAPPPTPAPDGPVQTVTYTASDELFPNPERGFYRYSINTDELTEHMVRECRSENITLIYRFYYLKKFRGGAPLSGALLSQIDADMAVLRRVGGKAVVRFAYSNSGTEPDAPLAVILRHLEQLRPVLQRNKDVIAVLQAGFIGAWGEWHSSKNGLDTDAARRAILDKLLDVVPAERFVQVRKPAYKRIYVGVREALPLAEAFGRSARARIGLHNDCFLSGKNDVGTYTDVAEEKAYLHDEGRYVPMGGETCQPRDVAPADCDKARAEMRRLRWSYLNRSYYEPVLEGWEAQGCMDEIARNMGYRIVLREGRFSERHAPGTDMTLSLRLRNVGYAPMFNPRRVELILRSADGSTIYTATLPDDPRRWQPDSDAQLSATVTLPRDIAPGNYRLFLFLPDPEPRLHDRPAFAVRFANRHCWEEATGYNDLGVIIRIERRSDLPAGRSEVRFVRKGR